MDSGEIQSVLSAQDLARSLTGFGYVMMQMINQPQRPSREEVTDFLFKYVTAPFRWPDPLANKNGADCSGRRRFFVCLPPH